MIKKDNHFGHMWVQMFHLNLLEFFCSTSNVGIGKKITPREEKYVKY